MTPAYTLKQVTYGYENGRVAINLPELTIPAAQVTALIGPNGAGKSTLLELLAFLRPASSGEIRFFGDPVRAENIAALRSRVGIVAQHPYLLRGSVLDNVQVGLRYRHITKNARQQRALAMLEQLGLGDYAHRDTAELSGGERQKVAIARTLVLEPTVLLLDEPFSHLDRNSLTNMERLIALFGRKSGHTLIFSTHDQLRAQALADNAISLIAGKPISNSLINLFHGRICIQQQVFDTGHIRIALPEGLITGTHLAVEPTQIVLSTEPLISSMRNTFEGRIRGLTEQNGKVRVSVEAGESFDAIITHEACEDQGLRLGKLVWVSFKSTAIQVF